jgi:hypothetical protein
VRYLRDGGIRWLIYVLESGMLRRYAAITIKELFLQLDCGACRSIVGGVALKDGKQLRIDGIMWPRRLA